MKFIDEVKPYITLFRVFLVSSILLLLIVRILTGPYETPAPPIISDLKAEDTSHTVLTKWVFQHSNRISMATCEEIVSEVMKTSKPLLILAIAEVESNFVPTALSPKGAAGLMQVVPKYWEKQLISKGIIKEVRDLFDIGSSVAAGDYVLNVFLKDTNGDISKALDKYLGGSDGVYAKRILVNLANLYVLTDGGMK